MAVSISTIQLKRCLNYKGTFQEAKIALKHLNPALKTGEPIIVGYYSDPTKYVVTPTLEQGPDRYFLGIGRYLGNDAAHIIVPLFDENNGQVDENGNITIADIEDKYEEAVKNFFTTEKAEELLQKYLTNDAASIVNVVSDANEVSDEVKQLFYEKTGKQITDSDITQQELNEFILENFLHNGKVYWDD